MVANSNSEANEYFHELIAWETDRAMCDCCQQRPWKYQRWACGIETYVCWVCVGETEEEQEE